MVEQMLLGRPLQARPDPSDPRALLLHAGDRPVELDLLPPMPGIGWYPMEQNSEGRFRWTGPEPYFTLELFLPDRPFVCRLELVNRGDFDGFAIELDSRTVPYSVADGRGKLVVEFEIPARQAAAEQAVFAFRHARVFTPAEHGGADRRRLGLAVCSIRFEPKATPPNVAAPRPQPLSAPAETAPPQMRALVIDRPGPAKENDRVWPSVLQHIRSLQRLGYRLTYVATGNAAPSASQTADLAVHGISCLWRPSDGSLVELLTEPPGFDLVYLGTIPDDPAVTEAVRRHLPGARVLYGIAHSTGPGPLDQRSMAAMRSGIALVRSAAAAEALRRLVPEIAVHVVPFPVEPRTVARLPGGRPAIALIGEFRDAADVDAAKRAVHEIMPLLRAESCGIDLLLVGSDLPEEVVALAASDVVPAGHAASLDDILGRVRLTIAPLRRPSGPQHAVLESLAAGIPCVMSASLASGLDLPRELGVLVADEPGDFARRIALLCRDNAEYARTAAAARAYVAARHAPGHVDDLMRRACGLP